MKVGARQNRCDQMVQDRPRKAVPWERLLRETAATPNTKRKGPLWQSFH